MNRWRWEVDPEGVMAAGLITFLGFIAGGRGWALAGIFGFWFVLGGIDFRKMPLPELNREERLHASAIFVSGEERLYRVTVTDQALYVGDERWPFAGHMALGGVAVDDAGVTLSIPQAAYVFGETVVPRPNVPWRLRWPNKEPGMIGFRHRLRRTNKARMIREMRGPPLATLY